MDDTTQRPATSRPTVRLPISLRTRLIAANIVIIALAIAALGYYVFYRGQQSTNYLSDQLDQSIRQKALDTLTITGNNNAASLNDVFASIRKDITNVGVSTQQLLVQQNPLSTGTYWDASQSLARLPNGSWDNALTSDPASIFVPAKNELTPALVTELNALKKLDFIAPTVLQADPDAVALYFGGPSGETVYYPNIDLANVVPPDFDVTQRPWYVAASPSKNPGRGAVWSTPYLDAVHQVLVVTGSFPIYDGTGFRGVVAMDVQLRRISYLVTAIRVGNTGYGFVIDPNGLLIAMPDQGYKDLGFTPETLPLGQAIDQGDAGQKLPPDLLPVITRMKSGQSGLETVKVNGEERYVVFRPIADSGYSLAIMVPASEMLAGSASAKEQIALSATDTQQISFVLMVIILGLALLATLGIGNTLTAPLESLTSTAQEITDGNLEAQAEVPGRDEIATLATALNSMTSRLRSLIVSLEQRVKDRTAALEVASTQATRRAAQFEAITQVTRAIGSIRNMDELMPLVAAVISQYFDFYHVGIFLNDQNGEYAWLIASNSEGGRRMLDRHHRLKIGEQGIVGYVASHGESRVARSVGEDAVFFNNPDLPQTRSEAALPLRRGKQIDGVLDVQSVKEDAFTDEDLRILAILADQVGLAMENTRLFETTRRSLTEAETLYRQYVQEAWNRLPEEGQITGYRYTPRGASPLLGAQDSFVAEGQDSSEAGSPLVVPIKLRGETIGNLVVRTEQSGGWTQDQVELVQAVAERVAFSAENARLLDETSRRAERERLVTEISSRIRSTNDPEEMIRTALEELRNALGATDIQVIPQVVPASEPVEGETMSTPAGAGQASQRGNGANQ